VSSALALELELAPAVEARPSGREEADALTPWRAPQDPQPPAAGLRGRPTLDDVVVGVWEGLLAHRPAGCPVCGAAMRPRPGSGAAAVGGRCDGCGTTIG
jgi:hypothetical protein